MSFLSEIEAHIAGNIACAFVLSDDIALVSCLIIVIVAVAVLCAVPNGCMVCTIYISVVLAVDNDDIIAICILDILVIAGDLRAGGGYYKVLYCTFLVAALIGNLDDTVLLV